MTWASDGMNDELFISIRAVFDAFLAQQIIVQIVDKMFLASHFFDIAFVSSVSYPKYSLHSSAPSVNPNIQSIEYVW